MIIQATDKKDFKYHQNKLKNLGYKKIESCSWSVVYEKGSDLIIIEKEF